MLRQPKNEPSPTAEPSLAAVPIVARRDVSDSARREIEEVLVNIEHQWQEAERSYAQLVELWNESGEQEQAALNKMMDEFGGTPEEFMADESNREKGRKALQPAVDHFALSQHPINNLRSRLLAIEHQLAHVEAFRKADDRLTPTPRTSS